MVSWPIAIAELRRGSPPRVKRERRFRLGWRFWLGYWLGGLTVAGIILFWRLYLPVWTLGV